MENSDIHFCSECHNMTFIYLNEEQDLIHYCEACSKSEPFKSENACIHTTSINKYDNSESINYNKFITHDITLPKIEGNSNIQCTNEECESIKEDKSSSVTYIKYDSENMKYIYICNYCGQKWKNS
jgi:DNA-directed RNA polymerase subunit M/transcription elongation factor TFIIS